MTGVLARIGVSPLDMRRFRPNLVVDGTEPFAEDGWQRVRIGEIVLRRTELGDRCAVTLVDPDTLERGPEPIRTLAGTAAGTGSPGSVSGSSRRRRVRSGWATT